MSNHTALAGRDSYDWLSLAVNVAVAAGTLALAWLAYHELRSKRAQTDRQDKLQTLERFIVPLRECFRDVRGCLEDRANPFRTCLPPLVQRMDEIVLQGSYHYATRDRVLLNELGTFKLLGQQVMADLRKLQNQSNAILDDLGSRLSGDTNRRSHPRAEVYWKGKRIASLSDNDFLGMWLHHVDLEGWLILTCEEYKGGPVECRLFHENNPVAAGNPADLVVKQLYSLMSERGFGNLFGMYGELRSQLEKVEKGLGKAWLQLSSAGRKTSGRATP